MVCRYVNDPIAGRVLIPGCMGVAVHNDMSYCTCKSNNSESHEDRIDKLEKQVRELKKLIKQNKAI